MKKDNVDIGSRNLDDIQKVNRELIEKALTMRCTSYLSQVKAKLLTETIFEIDSSKKRLQSTTCELEQNQRIIACQKRELEEKNTKLRGMNEKLDQLVSERTSQLEQIVFELKESEERYSNLFQESFSVMLLIDPENGRVVDANNRAVTFYGWSKKELTRKKVSDINALSEQQVSEKINSVKRNKGGHYFFQHRLASGEIRDVEVYSNPIKVRCRTFLFSIVHDITERREAERRLWESEATARVLLNTSPDAAFLIDPDGTLITLNAVTAKRLGKTVEEVEGKCAYDLLPQEIASSRRAMLEDVVATGRAVFFQDQREGLFINNHLCPVLDEEGNVSRIAVFARDVTHEKRIERKLRDNERFLASIFNAIKDGISVLSPDLRILHTNDAVQTLFSHKFPLENSYCFKAFRDREEQCTNCPALRAMESGKVETEEKAFTKSDNSKGLMEVWAHPMLDDNGKVVGVVEYMRDITKTRQAEINLRETILREKEAVAAANVGLWDWNLITNSVQYSDEWKRQIGYGADEIANDFVEWEKRVHPEDLPKVREALVAFQDGIVDRFESEFRFLHKNGEYIWILAKASLLKENNIPVRMIGSHLDITERVQTEKKIEASLREKEILLREIHHRVKNNLATVISLLNLQALQAGDERITSALADSCSRVKAMGLIHETLYRSENLAAINLESYVKKLGTRLLQSMRHGDEQIRLTYEIDGIYLDFDQAVPFGIILNELLTNALKYAFPERDGEILIKVSCKGEYIELVVHDNGVGMPEDKELTEYETLGLNIVSNIVESQLEGCLSHTNDNGARFEARWARINTT